MRKIEFTTEMRGRGVFNVSFIGIDPANDWDYKEMEDELKANFLQAEDKAYLPMCLTAFYYKNGESIAIFDLIKFEDTDYKKPAIVVYSYQTTAG